jgi:hypothetical protein
MNDWLQHWDIFGTTTVVAVLSGLVAMAVCAMSQRAFLRWSAALFGPFIIAAALYYLPTDPVESGSWAGLFISIWGVAGTLVSLLVVFLWTITTRRSGNSAV